MKNRIFDMTHIIRRAINTLDHRLMSHGEKVSYLMLKMCEKEKKYTEKQLLKICFIGLFHDIGAYQPETIDSWEESYSYFLFKESKMLPHAVFSYIYLSDYSFLMEFVDSVLFHHFNVRDLEETDCINKNIASKLYIADNVDVLIMHRVLKNVEDVVEYLKDDVFNQEEVKNLLELEKQEGVISKCFNGEYINEINPFLNKYSEYDEEADALIHLIPFVIDARNENSVTHTKTTIEISLMLCKFMELSEARCLDVYFGALLHDVGKVSIQSQILEKEGTLTKFEFDLVKDHAFLTEYILKGCVSDNVFKIATRHHEKLDGTGYPNSLLAKDLSCDEQIVAVADVLSALMGKRSYKSALPKKQIIEILEELANDNKLNKEVIEKAVENYDEIWEKCAKLSIELMTQYNNQQYLAQKLMNKYM